MKRALATRHRLLLPALALTLGLLPALAAPASGAQQDTGAPAIIRLAKGEMSLDQAVAMVRKRFGGKVISAETVSDGGKTTYVIKLLSDEGRVRTVRVDAESGKIR